MVQSEQLAADQILIKINQSKGNPTLQKLLELDDILYEQQQRKRDNDKKMAYIESQIYAFEGKYLENGLSSNGDLARGYDGFLATGSSSTARQSGIMMGSMGYMNSQSHTQLSSSSSQQQQQQYQQNLDNDRIFSTSSATYQKSLQNVQDLENGVSKKKKAKAQSSTKGK
ncbi:hypothetical protein MIR68_006049 [Amoeboaphelidium protococcarum]|nr:hypothetical protein MIR68_006049 [Amoeboaphelidium protococcarum]